MTNWNGGLEPHTRGEESTEGSSRYNTKKPALRLRKGPREERSSPTAEIRPWERACLGSMLLGQWKLRDACLWNVLDLCPLECQGERLVGQIAHGGSGRSCCLLCAVTPVGWRTSAHPEGEHRGSTPVTESRLVRLAARQANKSGDEILAQGIATLFRLPPEPFGDIMRLHAFVRQRASPKNRDTLLVAKDPGERPRCTEFPGKVAAE